ncbi:MAG: 23S rRNA (guanosine(2251)-2'-O)-methyltransferase RlmB [Syntrophobacteraceae bacterium]|nr:23S rRNA (guanosine(2251)-2'-O)-methyltransferase RlmB [Syntrophobacteraceae bacterium]
MSRKPPDLCEKTLWIAGLNPVSEALRSGGIQIFELVLARRDARIEEIRERAEARSVPVRIEDRDALTRRLGHGHHQGVAALVAEFPTVSLEAWLDRPLEEREPLLILDTIQDPQNLGAILRSGCFLGAKAVVLPRDRAAQVTGAVIKVAAGGASHVPVLQVTNLVRAMEMLKDSGLWIAGLDARGTHRLYDADLTPPMGLVIGNEQKGLRPLVRRQCDLLLHIPARGPIDSLNAATAGAIALAELQRQRSKGHRPD